MWAAKIPTPSTRVSHDRVKMLFQSLAIQDTWQSPAFFFEYILGSSRAGNSWLQYIEQSLLIIFSRSILFKVKFHKFKWIKQNSWEEQFIIFLGTKGVTQIRTPITQTNCSYSYNNMSSRETKAVISNSTMKSKWQRLLSGPDGRKSSRAMARRTDSTTPPQRPCTCNRRNRTRLHRNR